MRNVNLLEPDHKDSILVKAGVRTHDRAVAIKGGAVNYIGEWIADELYNKGECDLHRAEDLAEMFPGMIKEAIEAFEGGAR